MARVSAADAAQSPEQAPGTGPGRPLQALVGLAPHEIGRRVARALDGEGPALLPVPDGTPPARVKALLSAMRADSVRSPEGVTALTGGVPARPDTALVITTSGSTGAPKGVELSAAALRASALASVDRVGAAPGEPWLCVLPAGHISGLQVIIRALVTGTEAVHAAFDTQGVAALARELGPHVSLVPTQLRRLLAAGVDPSDLGTVLLGGAAAEPALLERARAAGARVVTTYGMSETCGGCVYDGVPLEGVRVRLESDSPGEPGRVLLSGPVLLSGYRMPPGVDDPGALERDGQGRTWLRTNDLGCWESGGRLSILGRMDDVVNSGGHKVVPGQVNALLAEHPAVAESVVVGRADPEWGQRVSAVVVPADPLRPPSLEELRDWVRERLPAYAAPRELELREHLPLLASGKPDLVALRTRTD